LGLLTGLSSGPALFTDYVLHYPDKRHKVKEFDDLSLPCREPGFALRNWAC
jgi:hypothetical protein